VANLLLVRGSLRQRELAIRSAIGASPWDLARQILSEATLLAAIGALGASASPGSEFTNSLPSLCISSAPR